MGCDIHLVLERKDNINGVEKWVGVHDFPYLSGQIHMDGENDRNSYAAWNARRRNYQFFGELAAVRGSGSVERPALGVPADASDLTLMQTDYWDADGHTHSYCSAVEFAERWLISQGRQAELVQEKLEGKTNALEGALDQLLGLHMEEEQRGDYAPDYRVVFWFDN